MVTFRAPCVATMPGATKLRHNARSAKVKLIGVTRHCTPKFGSDSINLRTWINLYPVYKAIDLPNRPSTYPVAHAWDSLRLRCLFFLSSQPLNGKNKKERQKE